MQTQSHTLRFHFPWYNGFLFKQCPTKGSSSMCRLFVWRFKEVNVPVKKVEIQEKTYEEIKRVCV